MNMPARSTWDAMREANPGLLARVTASIQSNTDASGLVALQADSADADESSGTVSPLTLVTTGYPQEGDQAVQEDHGATVDEAPLDLPTSPKLVEHEVGEAPRLPLTEESVAQVATPSVVEAAGTPVAALNLTGKTVIPAGWTFKGEIEGAEAMQIDCKCEGVIRNTANALLELGPNSETTGAIHGRSIHMMGKHSGQVNAANGSVTIESSAKVNGDVTYTSIQINGGVHKFQLQYVPGSEDEAIGA